MCVLKHFILKIKVFLYIVHVPLLLWRIVFIYISISKLNSDTGPLRGRRANKKAVEGNCLHKQIWKYKRFN